MKQEKADISKLVNDVRAGDAVKAVMETPGMKLILERADIELSRFYGDLNQIRYDQQDFDPDKDMKRKNIIFNHIAGANKIRTIPESIIARGEKARRKLNKMKEEKGEV